MRLNRSHFQLLFKLCGPTKLTNKTGLVGACKHFGIPYPYTSESKDSIQTLQVIKLTTNPNGHNYPLRTPILALARMASSEDHTKLDWNAGGAYYSENIYLGNWMPWKHTFQTSTPAEFLQTIPETDTHVEHDWAAYSGSSHGTIIKLLEKLSECSLHAKA